MFLRLLELSTVVFLLYILIFQITLPLIAGIEIFPMFRKTGKLQSEITSKKTDLHNEELLSHLGDLDTQINEKKKARETK